MSSKLTLIDSLDGTTLSSVENITPCCHLSCDDESLRRPSKLENGVYL